MEKSDCSTDFPIPLSCNSRSSGFGKCGVELSLPIAIQEELRSVYGIVARFPEQQPYALALVGFLADPTPCDKARSLVGVEIGTGTGCELQMSGDKELSMIPL